MKNKPILTSIIFTYNHDNTIEHCINGMLEQKTTYPYEIQIWDDCSIDKTSEICKEYAEKYPEKIKYYRQEKNTFTLPYKQMQAYKAIRNIKTKYWCMMDGDDWWCDENKVQSALDFLENNPEYVGFAHDTNYVCNGENLSYIHDVLKINPPDKITFDKNTQFLLLINSRIFRNLDFDKIDVLPIDYQMYYYHLSKGPIYYLDKRMSTYNVSVKSTFAYNADINLCLMQPYKIFQITEYKNDEFCTKLLEKYLCDFKMIKLPLIILTVLKKLFGTENGWKIWYFFTFCPKYGLECLSLSYIYSNRKNVKKRSDETAELMNSIKSTDQAISKIVSLKNKLQKYKKRNIILIIILSLSIIMNVISLFFVLYY